MSIPNLKDTFDAAVAEYQQLQQQYNQIQQELLVRQGSIQTLQQLLEGDESSAEEAETDDDA